MSQLPHSHTLPSFGGVELIRRLGVGGMGEVWLAHRNTGRTTKPVAIKIMAAHLSDSPEHLRLFESEIRLSMLLNHSNIVQVFDLCQLGERRGLVMEWVDGVNLEQLLEHLRDQRVDIPFDVAAYVLGELLKALAYAHNHGERAIVHRDISPHNVLLSVSGQVKLADFGVARVISDSSSGANIRGKLRYMAPEQASGASSKESVDIYAVGALFHELLEGERFRHDVARDELFSAVLAGEAPELNRAGVPPVLEELRAELLRPRIVDRTPSASAALAKLRQWSGYRNVGFKLAQLVREAAKREREHGATDELGSWRSSPQSNPQPSVLPRVVAVSLLSLGAGLGLAALLNRPSPASVEGDAARRSVSTRTSGPSAGRARELAEVTFVASDAASVDIMIADRALQVAPIARVELPAGRHPVRLRDAQDRWRMLGELVVEPGKQYRVDLVESLPQISSD